MHTFDQGMRVVGFLSVFRVFALLEGLCAISSKRLLQLLFS